MKRLFEPASIASMTLKNHVAMAPMTRQRADAWGVQKPFVADYYAQRAGAGLLIAEGTQTSFGAQGYCRTPGIHTREQVAAWKQVTDAVHARGAKIFLQLMHAGRIAHALNRQIEDLPVAPSAVRCAGQIWTDQMQLQDFPEPRALAASELAGVIEEFADAARNAVSAGFDGVELHAANGYLLSQFLATNTNQRTDRYGGSLSGRIAFVVECVEAVAAAIGPHRTGIRVSPGITFNDINDRNPLATHRALFDALPSKDLAYIHIMLPDAEDADALVRVLRAHSHGPLLVAGGLTADRAESMLASGLIQLAVFGRPFIANPDLVERFKSGAALAELRADLLYTAGSEGYSDYATREVNQWSVATETGPLR